MAFDLEALKNFDMNAIYNIDPGVNPADINFGYNPVSGNWEFTQSSIPNANPTTLLPPPPPPSPTPQNIWLTTPTFSPGVKQAEPDIILDPEIDTTGDYIVERFFEELGGTELINISRYDLIDGINVVYNPIANLSKLRQRFNPNNIIAIDALSQNEFAKFTIDLIARGISEPYFDNDGNLVVEVDIIRAEESIDVEISESGTVSRIEL